MLGPMLLFGTALLIVIITVSAMVAVEAVRPQRRTAAYAVARGLPCDPADAGLGFEPWTLDRPHGVRLAVWDVAPCTGEPAENRVFTVVFVHGWGQSKIDMLARHSPYDSFARRMIFYDLRGHGESSGLCRLGSGEDVDDLLELLNRVGDREYLLVGHSMGAVVSIHAAARDRDASRNQVRGIVCYGAYTSTLIPLANRLKALRQPSLILPDLALLLLRCIGIRDVRTRTWAAALDIPVLFIQGGRDRITPMEDVQAIAAAAADARLEILPEAGHIDAHTTSAERHADLVRSFVEGLRSTAAFRQSGHARERSSAAADTIGLSRSQ